MPETELTKLRRARSRCHLKLKQAEALVAGYQAKLADLEGRIQAIAPDLRLPPRFYQRNPIFQRGELPRMTLAILRQAGEPLPVAVITRRLLAAKGVTLPDRDTFRLTKNRLHNALLALDRRGVTVKVGNGRATRRGLAAPTSAPRLRWSTSTNARSKRLETDQCMAIKGHRKRPTTDDIPTQEHVKNTWGWRNKLCTSNGMN